MAGCAPAPGFSAPPATALADGRRRRGINFFRKKREGWGGGGSFAAAFGALPLFGFVSRRAAEAQRQSFFSHKGRKGRKETSPARREAGRASVPASRRMRPMVSVLFHAKFVKFAKFAKFF